jgi:hypothetical protein
MNNEIAVNVTHLTDDEYLLSLGDIILVTVRGYENAIQVARGIAHKQYGYVKFPPFNPEIDNNPRVSTSKEV